MILLLMNLKNYRKNESKLMNKLKKDTTNSYKSDL